jgi:hypothetical protein
MKVLKVWLMDGKRRNKAVHGSMVETTETVGICGAESARFDLPSLTGTTPLRAYDSMRPHTSYGSRNGLNRPVNDRFILGRYTSFESSVITEKHRVLHRRAWLIVSL